MDGWLQDLRFAARSLRRTPGYTAVVVAVMALGIGINTMVFAMVYGVLYRPLPLPQAERLTAIRSSDPRKPKERYEVSFMNLRDYRGMKSFESVGGYWDHNALVNFGQDTERLYASTVTYDLFDALGVKPILGHAFRAEEEPIGQNWTSIVISERIWKSRFGGTPDVLGKTVRMNGRTRTIVGVMPAGFRWPEIADFWIPMGFDPKDEKRNSFGIQAVGRLKPGTTAAQADAEMRVLMASLEKQYPRELKNVSAVVMPIRDSFNGDDLKLMMLMLQTSVAFVLLIACANVANLMLARAAGRRREISLRLALGASRAQVIRQLLIEGIVVSLAGAAIGVLLAMWGQRLWLSMIPLELPMFLSFPMDAPVLLFTVGVSVLSGLLFALAPALHASDERLSEALRDGASQAGSSRGRNRLRSGLVVAEIALSLVLLVGAGLMLKSFTNRAQLQKNLRIDGVSTGGVLMPVATYPENRQKIEFVHGLLADLRGTPGVSEVALAQTLPLGRNGWGRGLITPEMKDQDPSNAPHVRYGIVTPGYFRALGIPIVAGRDFNEQDTPTSQRVVIVSRALVQKHWPGQDAVGRRLKFAGEPDSLGWATVVGVVGDVLQNIEDDDKRLEQAYAPHDQDPVQMMWMAVRSDRPSAEVMGRMRELVRGRDADLPLLEPRTFREHVRFSMWTHRLFTSLFGTFAVLALLIAGIGIYGVMSYSVGQRTQEIGVRMALGADPAAVVRMVTLQAVRLTLLGIALGLAGAFGLTRFMATMLFQVSPTDPPTFTIVCVLLALSGIVAAWLPALRASRVDPMVALRYE